MACAFTLDHYREILRAAREGGYRFAGFDGPPAPGDLLLRHDVDLSLEAALDRLRVLGHRVGLHAVYPDADLDGRFDRVVAWHNPEPAYMTAPIDGAVNVMAETYFDPATYRSDSNQRWRSGCPHEELRAGAFPWLQVLVHPEIWVYPGETMGRTMEAMLDAQRAHRLALLADDRIDLE